MLSWNDNNKGLNTVYEVKNSIFARKNTVKSFGFDLMFVCLLAYCSTQIRDLPMVKLSATKIRDNITRKESLLGFSSKQNATLEKVNTNRLGFFENEYHFVCEFKINHVCLFVFLMYKRVSDLTFLSEVTKKSKKKDAERSIKWVKMFEKWDVFTTSKKKKVFIYET